MNSPLVLPGEENDISPRKILIVDDDERGRELTSMCLQSFGFETIEFRSGSEVIERWNEICDHVALMLTDVVMPGGVSGIELGEWVRIRAPHVGVVFCSGFTRHPFSGNFRLKEGENFISKPFSMETLVAVIRRNLPQNSGD